jgi:hypothetical protein
MKAMQTTMTRTQRPADKITPRERNGLVRWRKNEGTSRALGPFAEAQAGAARAQVHPQFQSVTKTAADQLRSPVS